MEEGSQTALTEGRPHDADDRIRRARSRAGAANEDFVLPTVKRAEGYQGINPADYVGGGGEEGDRQALEAIEEAKRRAANGGAAIKVAQVVGGDSLDSQESGAMVRKGEGGIDARNALMMKLAARAGLQVTTAVTTEDTAGGAAKGRVDEGVESTSTLLLRNCFNPDEENEEEWWKDIEEDMKDECGKFGVVLSVAVDREDKGGLVKVAFGTVKAAEDARKVFEGRWFGERQIRCDFV